MHQSDQFGAEIVLRPLWPSHMDLRAGLQAMVPVEANELASQERAATAGELLASDATSLSYLMDLHSIRRYGPGKRGCPPCASNLSKCEHWTQRGRQGNIKLANIFASREDLDVMRDSSFVGGDGDIYLIAYERTSVMLT
jgi:hypothetical protein